MGGADHNYDVIFVGTGFASSFFLMRYLERVGPNERVLVLERGRRDTHAWQIQHRKNSSFEGDLFVNEHPTKTWVCTIGFGGGSNCWWAATPRMMPNDFKLRSRYGVGSDWPLDYSELEPFYCQAEQVMQVSGSNGVGKLFPRSVPFPQPPHRLTDPDKLLQKAFPDTFFPQPTARARKPTQRRPACCATSTCNLCPVNAKFSIQNELGHLYEDPRVTLRLLANVKSVDIRGNVARGVEYLENGKLKRAYADLVVLGANAMFNAFIMMRSGLEHPLLGKYLCEQVSKTVIANLDGIDNYQGSTSMTGHGYMFYDGPHRSKRSGGLVETYNAPELRAGRGKWRQRIRLKFTFEDFSRKDNYVTTSSKDPNTPETIYAGCSRQAQAALDAVPNLAEEFLAPLPVESIDVHTQSYTDAHILGTTVMGNDPTSSVVDRHLAHHSVRNLLVLGGGAFPTVNPANPTLTISALSLWSAEHLLAT